MGETVQTLILALREQVLKQGCGSIKGLGLAFKRLDIDYSRRIVYPELKLGLEGYGIRMSENYLQMLFRALDKDDSGGIDFLEFMKALRPPLSDCRIDVINEAFDKLDVNSDQILNVEDVKVVCAENAKRHPKFLSGEWTEDQVFRNFLDGFDTPDDPDGIVTREEFMNYYAVVSSMFDDDQYFDLMMRSVYGLPPKGSRKKLAQKE